MFNTYGTSGVYTVSVTLTNNLLVGYTETVTQQVEVLDPISGLQANAAVFCVLNIPCGFSATVTSGSSIMYQWLIDGVNQSSTIPTISYTFTQV